MLNLLDKRNCPVCGGILKCENADFTNHFIEKRTVFKCDMAMHQLCR